MVVVEWITFALDAMFLLAGLAALRLWWRHRSPATAWLLATFAIFSVLIVSTLVDPEVMETGALGRALTMLLLVSPYLLFRFADAVVPAHRGVRWAADLLTVLVVAGTALLPEVPGDTGARSVVQNLWFVTALMYWAASNVAAGWLLVRGSVGEPGVVRNRLRVLAVAAIGLGVVIPATSLASGGGDPSFTAQALSDLALAVLGGLFLVGFAPPALLRAAWRHEDEQRLYQAAVALMAAEDLDAVAAVVVPGLRQLLGAPGVTLRDRGGAVVARAAVDSTRPRRIREVRTRQIGDFRLEILVAPTMPIFGVDEDRHLDRLALLAELALDRARLLQAERSARAEVERLNGELESFVYTTSHDLKNPVIALIGYLDVLGEDHAEDLDAEVLHIVQRMDVNARHMDALIRDLLELSRIGSVDVVPERVDLDVLVDDVARDVTSRHPALSVERGSLPVLWMNATRARQLLTNLLDNAAAHGGRPDVTVSVTAEPCDDGVQLWVRDDGRGIPAPHLDRVFGVFEQLDHDGSGGTGMGLAICRRLLERLGGAIEAVPSDGGAVFRIDLPAGAIHRAAPHVTLEEATP